MASETWQSQLKNALRSTRDCENFFDKKFSDLDYPVFIPKNLAIKIKEQGFDGPLAKQFLPSSDETIKDPLAMIDPIGDMKHSPIPGLVHRYPNKVLLFPTSRCPVICRYCFRKNELYEPETQGSFKINLDQICDYLSEHKNIEEVILSGGDPFMLSDKKLLTLFKRLAQIENIKFLRIHTRFVTILPERFSKSCLEVLKFASDHFAFFHIATHFNHASEMDQSAREALAKLKSVSSLLGQSVLLKGVNDHTRELLQLFETMLKNHIRPYYLHHPDQALGTAHYYVDLQRGRQLFAAIRGKLPGWAMPQYTLDLPGGAGKVNAFSDEVPENPGVFHSPFGIMHKYQTCPSKKVLQ